ncbi:YeeE/YedE family protein [Kiloniella antarctica]|uniref:YeeE/YedE family protein n=1 Tax=Kiloniella antarctica TaxID=1550907 RepID=A0ABW5BGX5_9PROT
MLVQSKTIMPLNRFLPLVLSLGVVLYLYFSVSERAAIATGLGVALGISLYHAAFGFTSAWRRFLTDRWGAGLKAQIIMLAVVVTLFFPVLESGEIFGHRVGGFVNPAGIGVAVGAFIFGIGMQLAGGCASGTLFTIGGGSIRMVVTLFTFMLGSVIATINLPFWRSLPQLDRLSMVTLWGWELALALHFFVFLGLYLLVRKVEKKELISESDNLRQLPFSVRMTQGPWPLVLGGVSLALLNFIMLISLGHPWGVTSGITLWGGKLVTFFGADLSGIPYWKGSMSALDRSLFRSDSSATNIGIIAGAMSAAFLAGKFGKSQNMTVKGILTALIGGLMLGYGARLAYGCNIGAFFSGVASGSLHGWLWLVTALAGNFIGVGLRKKINF